MIFFNYTKHHLSALAVKVRRVDVLELCHVLILATKYVVVLRVLRVSHACVIELVQLELGI